MYPVPQDPEALTTWLVCYQVVLPEASLTVPQDYTLTLQAGRLTPLGMPSPEALEDIRDYLVAVQQEIDGAQNLGVAFTSLLRLD